MLSQVGSIKFQEMVNLETVDADSNTTGEELPVQSTKQVESPRKESEHSECNKKLAVKDKEIS